MSNRLRKMSVIDLSNLGLGVNRTALRVFMLADNVNELEPTSRKFQKAVWSRAQKSVARRGIDPVGVWVLAFSALDMIPWEEHFAPHVVDQIHAQMRDMAGTEFHWRVCALVDSMDLKKVQN